MDLGLKLEYVFVSVLFKEGILVKGTIFLVLRYSPLSNSAD